MQTTQRRTTDQLIADSRALIEEAKTYLEQNGVRYSLGEWVTLKEYAKRFDVKSTNVISNWIARGIVPPENVITVEEMNGLKLIKAIPYP